MNCVVYKEFSFDMRALHWDFSKTLRMLLKQMFDLVYANKTVIYISNHYALLFFFQFNLMLIALEGISIRQRLRRIPPQLVRNQMLESSTP